MRALKTRAANEMMVTVERMNGRKFIRLENRFGTPYSIAKSAETFDSASSTKNLLAKRSWRGY
jgi:hypothetical protein